MPEAGSRAAAEGRRRSRHRFGRIVDGRRGVARVSREAPVLILEYDSTAILPGAAGNAANNVAALGGRAVLASIIGRDEPAGRLLKSLHRGVDTRGVARVPGRVTAVKTRIL